jgi:DNA topoisomerase I
MLKLGRRPNGEKYTAEELSTLPIEDVKNMIEEQVPGAFTKKVAAKKTATKKAAPKKKTAAKKKK